MMHGDKKRNEAPTKRKKKNMMDYYVISSQKLNTVCNSVDLNAPLPSKQTTKQCISKCQYKMEVLDEH